MRTLYFDNNATTKPLPSVVEAVTRALTDAWGNPSSHHGPGEAARREVDAARAVMAELIHARPTEIVFTAGATEATNTALRGAFVAARETPARIVTTAVEHEATIEVAAHLKSLGARVDVIGVDGDGALDMEQARRVLTPGVTICSAMFSNNETGVLLPVVELGALCRERGIPFHVDATQAIGKAEIDVDALNCDFLSLSAHKFHGPKGVGLLYVRRNARFRKFLVGAPHEGGRRAGTENTPGILGMAAAARHVMHGIADRRAHLQRLGDHLQAGLLSIDGTRLNGAPNGRIPGTVNVSFRGIEGSAVVLTVARDGLCVSAGSACSAAQFGGSHVLEAMGLTYEWLHGAVRFSCCESNTIDEVDEALRIVRAGARYLRDLDPAKAHRA